MSSDPVVKAVAEELMLEWFPTGNDTDPDVWWEIAHKDAEAAVRVARAELARLIDSDARENHRHVDVGGTGICPTSRLSPGNCDLVAAYKNAARLVRGN